MHDADGVAIWGPYPAPEAVSEAPAPAESGVSLPHDVRELVHHLSSVADAASRTALRQLLLMPTAFRVLVGCEHSLVEVHRSWRLLGVDGAGAAYEAAVRASAREAQGGEAGQWKAVAKFARDAGAFLSELSRFEEAERVLVGCGLAAVDEAAARAPGSLSVLELRVSVLEACGRNFLFRLDKQGEHVFRQAMEACTDLDAALAAAHKRMGTAMDAMASALGDVDEGSDGGDMPSRRDVTLTMARIATILGQMATYKGRCAPARAHR